MTERPVTEPRADAAAQPVEPEPVDGRQLDVTGALVVAALAGAGLAFSARSGALGLLVVIAVVQAALGLAWTLVLRVPGRYGGLVIGAFAAAAADVVVSVWPHGRLGALLAVLGLAVPVMFVHQLWRGAARAHAVDSLGGIAMLVLAVVSLPALAQLRHEFLAPTTGGRVVAAVAGAAGAALVAGWFADLVTATPRFDDEVPRGLFAVLVSAVVGAAVAAILTRGLTEFAGGRGAFAGAAVGALVGLLAVAMAFMEYSYAAAPSSTSRRMRPVLAMLVPLSVVAPVAFLLCLAIRS